MNELIVQFMPIRPVIFGRPDRRLVGNLFLPDEQAPRVGFVLCRPFASEAIRSAVFFRAMARRLSDEGCAVLVFDYHGTGESPGDFGLQSLEAWQQDILSADAFLRETAGVGRCHWFGLGLGASLAFGAARQVLAQDQRPGCLVAWEPVENGRSYVDTLCDVHRRELERWYRGRWDVIERDILRQQPSVPGEVLGFDVGPGVAQGLYALMGLPVDELLNAGIRIVAGRLRGATPWTDSRRLQILPLEHLNPWMTNHVEEGGQTTAVHLVPNEAILAARDTLVAPGPTLL